MLDDPSWVAAFEEAWASWKAGCFGIGAVVVGPDGDIVARGRNRVLEARTEPGVLAGTMLAHAEMNALGQLEWGSMAGRRLLTTLEPCLLCASATIFLSVPEVHFAGADPWFEGVHDGLGAIAYCEPRMPVRVGPLDGPVRAFAELLPLTFLAVNARRVWPRYEEATPALTALADELVDEGTLAAVRDAGGSVSDAFDAVADRLP